jgi:hypothetical protein
VHTQLLQCHMDAGRRYRTILHGCFVKLFQHAFRGLGQVGLAGNAKQVTAVGNLYP